jgi:hypothetical protein
MTRVTARPSLPCCSVAVMAVVVVMVMVMMVMAAWLGFCYTADKHHTDRGEHYTAGNSGQRRHQKFSDKNLQD